jgi:hypothetical protein
MFVENLDRVNFYVFIIDILKQKLSYVKYA